MDGWKNIRKMCVLKRKKKNIEGKIMRWSERRFPSLKTISFISPIDESFHRLFDTFHNLAAIAVDRDFWFPTAVYPLKLATGWYLWTWPLVNHIDEWIDRYSRIIPVCMKSSLFCWNTHSEIKNEKSSRILDLVFFFSRK